MDQPVKAESDREVQRMELNAPNTEHANNSWDTQARNLVLESFSSVPQCSIAHQAPAENQSNVRYLLDSACI